MTKRTMKVNYGTIEKGKAMPIAYAENGKIKTVFRTVKEDEQGFFVSINSSKQYIIKLDTVKFKGISTIVVSGTCAIIAKVEDEQPKQEQPKKEQPKKQAKKAPKKSVKKQVESIVIEEVAPIEYNGELPKNILDMFPVQSETIKTVISNYVKYANKKNGKHLENEKIVFSDGMKALSFVQSFKELQGTIVAYFLTGIAKYMIRKFLEFGASYKKLNNKSIEQIQAENSYQNASSNNGKITAFEVDDVYQSLVVEAYTKTFDKSMFDSINYVNTSLFFRISNLLRTEIRRLRYQTKVNIGDAMKYIPANEGIYDKQSYDYTISLVNDLSFLSKDEKTILELRLQGYQKKEIYSMMGRVDRKIKSMENKLESKAGKTLKQAKKDGEMEKKSLSEKLQAMKQAKKAEKVAMQA